MNPVPPFEFRDCALITLSTGKSAQSLRELGDRIAEVGPQSLLHHFHETLLRPSFDDPEYPNDFAVWAGRSLHDDVLAERLGIVDPLDFDGPEALRAHLADLIDERMAEIPYVDSTRPGHEFRFLYSQIVVFSNPLRARTPQELLAHAPALSTGTIFYHFVDARRRNPERLDDFSLWLREWGGLWACVSEDLESIGFHHKSLAEIRAGLAACLAGIPADLFAH